MITSFILFLMGTPLYKRKPADKNMVLTVLSAVAVSASLVNTNAQKMNFFIKNFFSKCDQIRRKLRIWSYLLKKPLMEKFIFCAVHHVIFIR